MLDKLVADYSLLLTVVFIPQPSRLISAFLCTYFVCCILEFTQNIGVDFALKVLDKGRDKLVRLQLWDVAGQERYGNMTRVYYKEAVGAFLVFDITRMSTFDAVNKTTNQSSLFRSRDSVLANQIPVVLLANKCDLIEEGFVASHLDKYCEEKGFLGWFETHLIKTDSEGYKFLTAKTNVEDKHFGHARPQSTQHPISDSQFARATQF
eukprot:sb/3470320/